VIFNIGGRVQYTSGRFGSSPQNPLKGSKYEATGTVSDVDSHNIFVNWDSGTSNVYSENDLGLVKNPLHHSDPNRIFRRI